MPRLNLTQEQVVAIRPLITPDNPNGNADSIVITVPRYKRPFKKKDKLVLYSKNLRGVWKKVGEVVCVYAEMKDKFNQRLTLKNTYDRRYYLNRVVKKSGFKLDLEMTTKTIYIPSNMLNAAKKNRSLNELGSKYNYGLQITLSF